MIKWWISQKTSNQCSQQSHIILKLWHFCQPGKIHQILRTLPLCSWSTGGLFHWTVDSLQKLVTCGIWKMISSQQNYMSSSSRHNSKETLLWTSITYTITSRGVSMRWLDSNNNFLLVTSPSKGTLSLKNTLSHIVITFPIIGVFIYTLTLDTHCWCQ